MKLSPAEDKDDRAVPANSTMYLVWQWWPVKIGVLPDNELDD